MAMVLCFTDAGKATTPAIKTIAASTPLQLASIDTVKPVVASRRMRRWAMTVSSKGKMMTVLRAANSPVKCCKTASYTGFSILMANKPLSTPQKRRGKRAMKIRVPTARGSRQ